MNVEGRRGLITGASRGIGRAIAHAFARRGARVAVNYRSNEAAARETEAALPGGPHALLRADVSRPDEAADLAARAVAERETRSAANSER